MPKKIPWEDIKREYIQGVEKEGRRIYPSQRDLAKKYGIDPAVIGRKASKDSWLTQRQIFISKLSAETQQKTIDEISDEVSQFDLECFKISQKGIAHINSYFKNAKERGISLTRAALLELSQALRRFQEIGKCAVGEKTGSEVDTTIKIISAVPRPKDGDD